MQPEHPIQVCRKEEQFTLGEKKLRTKQPQGAHVLGQHYELEWVLLNATSIQFSKRPGFQNEYPRLT